MNSLNGFFLGKRSSAGGNGAVNEKRPFSLSLSQPMHLNERSGAKCINRLNFLFFSFLSLLRHFSGNKNWGKGRVRLWCLLRFSRDGNWVKGEGYFYYNPALPFLDGRDRGKPGRECSSVIHTYMGSERVAKNGSHVSLAPRKGFVLGKSKKTNIVKKSKREKTRYYRKREWELGIAGVCAPASISFVFWFPSVSSPC